MASRNKKFVINSMMSIIQQFVTVVCGLILPQLILKTFGSSVNGTVSSITQYLSFITLLQGGVGTVARLAFYKPLAENDTKKISIAYKTVSVFYQKFAGIFFVYLLILSVVYPVLVHTGFEFGYVCTLALIVGIGSVFEYFFGQASQMLLFSAQKNYIFSALQIVCTLISTIVGVLLVNNGASIHIVKLVSALIYIVRPVSLAVIVKKQYNIDPKVKEDPSLLSQRNSALVRHVAFYVHSSTDIMVLTAFTNVLWVSVYSVHKYVISSLSNFITAILGNTEVVYGDMLARNEYDKLHDQVPVYDLFSKILCCCSFFTCIILISRFVAIYTNSVTDINYYHPLFATILALSELIYCMSLTYQSVFIAAGHIKKTEWMSIVEAAINLIISVLTVNICGLLGVAIGTLAAMLFRTVANIMYMRKNVLDMPLWFIVKSYIVNLGTGIILTSMFWTIFYKDISTYSQFFMQAIVIFGIVIITYILVNWIFFKEQMGKVLVLVKNKFVKR